MTFVYWIHLEEHSDIYTEGYVGITTADDPIKRFRKHQSDARNPSTSFVVHNAMNKYGDDIKFTVLHECSKDEATSLEEHYRPQPNIGWNILKGGDHPLTGRTWSDSQREKFKATRKSAPPPVRNPLSTLKHKTTFENKHPLDLHGINLELWSHCIILYDLFLKGDSSYVATRRLNFSKGSVSAMWKRFNTGWNPKQDDRILLFVQENPPTRTPDMTDTLSNTEVVGVVLRGNRYVAYIKSGDTRASKSFSILKYGSETALQLAIKCRQEFEEKYAG